MLPPPPIPLKNFSHQAAVRENTVPLNLKKQLGRLQEGRCYWPWSRFELCSMGAVGRVSASKRCGGLRLPVPAHPALAAHWQELAPASPGWAGSSVASWNDQLSCSQPAVWTTRGSGSQKQPPYLHEEGTMDLLLSPCLQPPPPDLLLLKQQCLPGHLPGAPCCSPHWTLAQDFSRTFPNLKTQSLK